MNQLNSIILEGNLVEDCQVKEPLSGFCAGTFTIAVNRFCRNRDGEQETEVSYFDIECYGNMTEYLKKKGKKGAQVRVVGRLKQARWTDGENQTHSRVFVIAEHIEYKAVVQKTQPAQTLSA